jgi:cytochrome c-type biogenesis protein CcmH
MASFYTISFTAFLVLAVIFWRFVGRQATLIGLVIVTTVLGYVLIGNPSAEALAPPAAVARSAPIGVGEAAATRARDAHPGSEQTLGERIKSLEIKLKDNPSYLEGWVLLARSQSSQRNFPEAVRALEQALRIAPDHPDILADLADALAMTQNRSLSGQPEKLIERVLQLDPRHRKGLALAATAATNRGSTAEAVKYWRRLQSTFPQDAPDVAQIDRIIADLRPSGPPQADHALRGLVRLSDELRTTLRNQPLESGARLFITARSVDGSPMPVAALSLAVSSLSKMLESQSDFEFVLNDSHSLNPQRLLSSQKELVLEARIARAGTANRQPGDLVSSPLKITSARISEAIVISSVLK